jgi:hypothetical protein
MVKQDVIRRIRLKFIKITMFQNKTFASRRPGMRDRRLSTKAKLKAGQMQNRAQENSIRDIANSADSIRSKASRSPMLIEYHPSHLN